MRSRNDFFLMATIVMPPLTTCVGRGLPHAKKTYHHLLGECRRISISQTYAGSQPYLSHAIAGVLSFGTYDAITSVLLLSSDSVFFFSAISLFPPSSGVSSCLSCHFCRVSPFPQGTACSPSSASRSPRRAPSPCLSPSGHTCFRG